VRKKGIRGERERKKKKKEEGKERDMSASLMRPMINRGEGGKLGEKKKTF